MDMEIRNKTVALEKRKRFTLCPIKFSFRVSPKPTRKSASQNTLYDIYKKEIRNV